MSSTIREHEFVSRKHAVALVLEYVPAVDTTPRAIEVTCVVCQEKAEPPSLKVPRRDLHDPPPG